VIYQFIVGGMTLLTGIVLIVMGTDFGNNIKLTMGVVAGSIMLLLGTARLKHAIAYRREYGDE
jgi:zinc transporter ZupT